MRPILAYRKGMAVSAVAWLAACSSQAVPDPKPVVQQWAEAVRRGDSKAVHALLTRESRRSLGEAGVSQRLQQHRQELVAHVSKLASNSTELSVVAQTQFVDGEIAAFTHESGELRLRSAAALPAVAVTPEEALSALRAALARRSYSGLVQVMTREGALALEQKLTSLVNDLSAPHTLETELTTEGAVVTTPNGHRVELRKEGGLWKVRDFE